MKIHKPTTIIYVCIDSHLQECNIVQCKQWEDDVERHFVCKKENQDSIVSEETVE